VDSFFASEPNGVASGSLKQFPIVEYKKMEGYRNKVI
jgi:hypothetical protein